jgi:general stress protein 26
MKIATFAEIEAEFVERAHALVWCAAATVGADGRPRTRLLHPVWEGGTGWITTRRHSPKEADLARTPYVSLAYVTDVTCPIYADCEAVWEDDPATKRRVWNLIASLAPPLGFDPAPIYGSADDPNFGLLKLTPTSVRLTNVMEQDRSRIYRVWRS